MAEKSNAPPSDPEAAPAGEASVDAEGAVVPFALYLAHSSSDIASPQPRRSGSGLFFRASAPRFEWTILWMAPHCTSRRMHGSSQRREVIRKKSLRNAYGGGAGAGVGGSVGAPLVSLSRSGSGVGSSGSGWPPGTFTGG